MILFLGNSLINVNPYIFQDLNYSGFRWNCLYGSFCHWSSNSLIWKHSHQLSNQELFLFKFLVFLLDYLYRYSIFIIFLLLFLFHFIFLIFYFHFIFQVFHFGLILLYHFSMIVITIIFLSSLIKSLIKLNQKTIFFFLLFLALSSLNKFYQSFQMKIH